MQKLLAVFPGQGSQFVGMGKNIYQTREGRYVFDVVDNVMGFPLSEKIFHGSIDELSNTEHLQPAIYAVSMAVWSYFIQNFNNPFSFVMGHSLGEYTAVVASSMISIEEGAELLKLRGYAMQQAAKDVDGLVAVVLGLDIKTAEDALHTSGLQNHQVCIANDNSAKQLVLSGIGEFVQQACTLLKQAGAKRTDILPITVPVHSIYMKSAADVMKKKLESLSWNKPSMDIFMNATATCERDVEAIISCLSQQIDHKIRFRECVEMATSKDIHKSIEFGPKNVLSNLIKRISPSIKTLSMQDLENVDKINLFLEDQNDH